MVRRPWDFVVLGSWLTGAIFILVAIVVAITGRGRTSLTIAVTGVLLIAAGLVVLAVVAATSTTSATADGQLRHSMAEPAPNNARECRRQARRDPPISASRA